MNHIIHITKADGSKEIFEEEKLIQSLRKTGTSDDVIEAVVEKIGAEMKEGMTTSELYHHAFTLLRERAKPVAARYSLRRALSELGPNGFPFEKFIAEIFKTRGYETLTDQTVMGGCVPHEVDVVAWKPGKLIMVEAKFHNEFWIKSDVKVALYVKARFDDIRENMFEYGGVKQPLSEGWLVTNTKFTDQAIHYAECKGLQLIGWNYPKDGSLEKVIEKSGLHPFTCLVSLSNTDKKALLEKGVVLCRDIKENPSVLEEVGMSEERMRHVLEEISMIC